MVSGSQLQVAKLAQMCPAAPSCTQQHTTATSVLSGGQQQPGSKPGYKYMYNVYICRIGSASEYNMELTPEIHNNRRAQVS